MLRRIARALDTGKMQVFEYQLPVADGVLHFEARLVVTGHDEVLSVVRDVTERKALEGELEHRAFHDALTGLPNRALLTDRIKHALARVESHGESVAVLFLDLDDFKVVNDSLGHEAADRLLMAVAERLQTVLRPEDTLARLGGDEFTVLLEDIEGASEATAVAERIADALREPFSLEGSELFVTTSIGIAFGNSAQDRPGGLLRSADLAMYRAKETGKAGYALFDPVMGELALNRLRLESELRQALEMDELRAWLRITYSQTGGVYLDRETSKIGLMLPWVLWRSAGGCVKALRHLPRLEISCIGGAGERHQCSPRS
jgi:diguanylate cyclase (GGDEF)-like protein